MRTLDAAEVRKLLSTAQGSRLYEAILIAVTTGMRRGSGCAGQTLTSTGPASP